MQSNEVDNFVTAPNPKTKHIEIDVNGNVFVVYDGRKTKINIDVRIGLLLTACLASNRRDDEIENKLLELEGDASDMWPEIKK